MSDPIDALGLRPMPGRLVPTEKLVRGFERRFELELPADYRRFLLVHGGSYASASAPFSVPTPIGREALVEGFFGFMTDETQRGDLGSATEIAGGAPGAIPIAFDVFGDWTFLLCRGPHVGSVLLCDIQQRAQWTDREFRKRFTTLDPSIEEYLRLRRENALPPSIVKAPDFYLVAPAFSAFLASCRPLD